MSEEGEVIQQGAVAEPEPAPEPPKFDPETREAKLAEKAAAQGWKTFEEHVESGGGPGSMAPRW